MQVCIFFINTIQKSSQNKRFLAGFLFSQNFFLHLFFGTFALTTYLTTDSFGLVGTSGGLRSTGPGSEGNYDKKTVSAGEAKSFCGDL